MTESGNTTVKQTAGLRRVEDLVRCCMNCANGESAWEKYGAFMYEHEEEDVFCFEHQELNTDGRTFVCEKWTPNDKHEPPRG